MKKLVSLILVVAMTAVMFAGCGAGDDKVIKFGMLGPQSGDYAVYGVAVRDGAQLAIDEINEAGGIDGKMIELVAYDSEGDPTKALNLFNRLVDSDKIHALLGGTFSGESLTVGPVADEKQIPMLSPTATNADVTLDKDFVFRACFIDPYQGRVAAKFAADSLGATKAVIFRNVSNDYAMGLADNFAASFSGEIVADEGYTNEDNDFKAIITKIADLEPDVIFVPDYKNMVGLIASQLKDAGLEVPMLGGDGWDGVQADYPDVMDGHYFTNHYSTEDSAEVIQSFISKYEAAYGEVPNALAALAYDAAYIMAEAIENAGSLEGAEIQAALKSVVHEGVTGHTEFDAQGDTYQKEAVIIKIEGGELKFETKMSE